jgi:CRP/FNR family transcriptional regulator, cyclic AMP receptor protein
MYRADLGGDVSDMLGWSADLPVVFYPAGAEVIREGEVHGSLLVLVEGTVEVSREGTVVAMIDEPGSVLGETSALLGGPATATVKCVGDCSFRRSDDPRSFMREHPGVALAVATTLARRLHTITGYLVDLRRQYADRSDHLGMVDVVLESLAHQQRATVEPGSDREPDAPY